MQRRADSQQIMTEMRRRRVREILIVIVYIMKWQVTARYKNRNGNVWNEKYRKNNRK